MKDAERWRKRHGVPQQTTPQKQWPLSVMQAAYSSGGLPISPGQATEALEAFDALTKYNRPAKSALLTLCKGEFDRTQSIDEESLTNSIQTTIWSL